MSYYLILNYEFASSKTNHQINKPRVTSVLNNSTSKLVEAACKLLLGDKSKAIEIVRDYISKNFASSSKTIKFPIFESIKEDLEKAHNLIKSQN